MSLTDEDPNANSPINYHGQPVESPAEMHVNCLIALKSWFDTFFTISTDTYFYIPLPIYVQLAHADVTLAKLTAFWSGRRPDTTPPDFPPFPELMENLARHFEAAKTAPHPLGRIIKNDVFDQWATRIRSFKALDFSMPRPPAPPGRARDDTPARTPASGSMSVQANSSTSAAMSESDAGTISAASTAADGEGGRTPESTSADWSTWFDGLQTSWIVGKPEPVTWQSSYDVLANSMQTSAAHLELKTGVLDLRAGER
jgi:hypothetical protein